MTYNPLKEDVKYNTSFATEVVQWAQMKGYRATHAFPNDLTYCEQCLDFCREWDIENEEDGVLVTLHLCIECITTKKGQTEQ